MNDDAGAAMDHDPGLAEALRVEPLDDLTRRRLVRTALDAARPTTSGRRPDRGRALAAVGVAASLLVGITVGAVVVTRPEQQAPPTAAGSDQRSASSAPDDAAPEAAAAPVAPQPLGDLGAVTDLAALAQAVDGRLQAGHSGEDAAAAPAPCVGVDDGSLVLVSAAGTATLAGGPVVVRVGPTPAGAILVVVLDAACSVLTSTPLPSA